MKRFVRNLVLSAAVAATALAIMPTAEAQSRNNARRGQPMTRMDPQTERLVGIGFLGLAAGVAIGAIAAESNSKAQRNPRPRPTQDRGYYVDDRRGGDNSRTVRDRRGRDEGPRYSRNERGGQGAGRYDPWTPGWARWCQNRYRSFNVTTGTYTTYGGEQRFCVVQ